MAFPNWGLFLILVPFLTYLAGLTIAQGNHRCGTKGNYTQISAYRKNLGVALSVLNETNENGFFMSSSHDIKGDEPSTAYALALCRGDLNQDDCLICVANAINQLTEDCHNQKKATGWYDGCILSYSDSSLVDNVDDNVDVKYFGRLVSYGRNQHNVTSWAPFNRTLSTLFQQLRRQAARGGSHKKYASGNMSVLGSMNIIYGIMQCSPFISQRQCDDCLFKATAYLSDCCDGSADGRVYYRYSCFLRYQTSLFFNESLSVVPPSTLSTPQLPGKKRRSHKIFIVPAIAATAVILILSIFAIRLKGIRNCREKGEELLAGSDDDTGEMIYFTLNVMHVATCNFSLANKLGEGGFGPVYSTILCELKAWMLLEEGKGEQLIDGNLKDDCPVNKALKWMDIALLCIQEDPKDRPTMSSVTFMLEGEWTSPLKPKPSMSFPKIIISEHSSSVSNSTDEVGFSSDQTLQDEGS
ncbi:hypothetical protein L6452_31181 [Arctium lappa]|uniref:Uncharacterized protein n=2 Tax=Arctium lappa TaxID=4217 RepID=A0ACB8ZKI4_ARCLA|nr:hypothetical protein L6452_31179 [Arctium lappa]KAI3698069.1 hypothetical protein L6452_31181 [Arctium lappa]